MARKLKKRQIKNRNNKIKEDNNGEELKYQRRKGNFITPCEFWKFFDILLVAKLKGVPGGTL